MARQARELAAQLSLVAETHRVAEKGLLKLTSSLYMWTVVHGCTNTYSQQINAKHFKKEMKENKYRPIQKSDKEDEKKSVVKGLK